MMRTIMFQLTVFDNDEVSRDRSVMVQHVWDSIVDCFSNDVGWHCCSSILISNRFLRQPLHSTKQLSVVSPTEFLLFNISATIMLSSMIL